MPKNTDQTVKLYNPETQQVVDVRGPEVRVYRDQGFLPVGNRPPEEYIGISRDELQADDDADDDTKA